MSVLRKIARYGKMDIKQRRGVRRCKETEHMNRDRNRALLLSPLPLCFLLLLLLLLRCSTVLEELPSPHVSKFLYLRFRNKKLFTGWSC
jgi:hypothetical protein